MPLRTRSPFTIMSESWSCTAALTWPSGAASHQLLTPGSTSRPVEGALLREEHRALSLTPAGPAQHKPTHVITLWGHWHQEEHGESARPPERAQEQYGPTQAGPHP